MTTFIGTDANNSFTGGSGTDTVTFADSAAGYRIDRLPDGRIQVVDIDLSNGNTGTDILSSIELLSFADKSYSVASGTMIAPQGVQCLNSTSGEQFDPAITMLADGGWVATWTAYDSYDTGVYARRFDSSGTPIGAEVRVNSTTANSEKTANVAAMQDGGYLITWASDDGASHNGIYTQRFDADGVRVGGETRVNTTTTDSRYQTPDIAVLANGDYVISWQGSELFAQRFDADGTPLGSQVSVTNDFDPYAAIYDQEFPALAGLTDGGYVICYGRGPSGLDGDELYARRYDADGVAVGTEFRVDTRTADDTTNPAIMGLSDGGFVIAWQVDTDSDSKDIYARRYDAAGNAVGIEIQVNTTFAETYGHGNPPAITELGGGDYVIAWSSRGDIYLQRFAADGQKVGGETYINGTSFSETPAITATHDGGYIVSWAAEEEYGSSSGTYAQRFDANGEAWGPQSMVINGTSAADVMHGGAGSQALAGLAGNDILDGGSGIDAAGFGGDALGYRIAYLGSGRVQIVDSNAGNGNTGTDTLANIEVLRFLDKDYSITVVEDRVLVKGTAGADVFTGGAGALQFYGLAGNDRYILTTSASRVVEAEGGGTDMVFATCTFSLGANVERLTLKGSGNINGTGNESNNILTGNDGDNRLNGNGGVDILIGGAGNDLLSDLFGSNDTMNGGSGNDHYSLYRGGATIVEVAGGGIDTVSIVSGNYTLGDNLENLWLEGDGSVIGNGNALNNVISGGDANNILNGGAGNDILIGGDGNDILTGGTGKDAFKFTRLFNGVDTVKDYSIADDSIYLNDPDLTFLNGPGALKAQYFRANATGTAADRDDYLLYETDTGKLFFDVDANGAGARVLIAVIGTSTHPALVASELIVV